MPGKDKDLTVVNKDKVRQCVKESFSRMHGWHYEYLSFVLFTLQNRLKKHVKFSWAIESTGKFRISSLHWYGEVHMVVINLISSAPCLKVSDLFWHIV